MLTFGEQVQIREDVSGGSSEQKSKKMKEAMCCIKLPGRDIETH